MRFTPKQFEKFEVFILNLGYRKYVQNVKNEDFAYWKPFERDENKKNGYSVGLFFYDWSKYPQFTKKENISCSLEFMLRNNDLVDRLDLTISDDRITIEQFEIFCKKFYDFYQINKL